MTTLIKNKNGHVSISTLIQIFDKNKKEELLTKEEKEILEDNDCYHFFDWFCSRSSLRSRFNSAISKIKFLIKHEIINPETTYVFLKNNCPLDGSLYDDIRFSLLEEKDGESYIGGFSPKVGYNSVTNLCHFWLFNHLKDKDVEIIEFEFKDWDEFKNLVKNNPEDERIVTIKSYFKDLKGF